MRMTNESGYLMAFIFNELYPRLAVMSIIFVQQLGQNLQPNESARYAVVAAIDYHKKKKDDNSQVRKLDI